MTAKELEVTIDITCTPLPDAAWPTGGTLHLGIQHGDRLLDATPVDRTHVAFHPVLRVRRHTDGSANFLGPFAHGPRNERFIYLNWIVMSNAAISSLPGRVKLHLSHIPWRRIEAAASAGKPVRVTVALSKADGKPVYASVRADKAQWE